MRTQDKMFEGTIVCYDQVEVKNDNNDRVLGSCRWNEVLVDAVDGSSMPAWKWQLWVEKRGEAEVKTLDGSLQGFIWPRKDGQPWLNKRVQQTSADVGFEQHIGRTGIVAEALVDEKGAVHCRTLDDVWCPARHLTRI